MLQCSMQSGTNPTTEKFISIVTQPSYDQPNPVTYGLVYTDIFQFGRVDDVVNDCCGYCPVPKTAEEKEVAEEEGKIYVSGKVSFMKDDPGRQVLGPCSN